MHAVKFLISEHNRFRVTIKKLVKTPDKTLFSEFADQLIHHEKMEQRIWYPHLKEYTNLSNAIDELITQEEATSNKIVFIKRISDIYQFEIELTTFLKDVLHHTNEEEINLFPLVMETLFRTELERIGKKLMAFERKLEVIY